MLIRSILIMLSVVIVSFVIALFTSPASAAEATWAERSYWKITAETELEYCRSTAKYDNGDIIDIAAGQLANGPMIAFTTRNLLPITAMGKVFEGNIKFSVGKAHQVMFSVLEDNIVMATVPARVLLDYADTAWMEVRVQNLLIGTYNLTGTSEMIEELRRCIRAMRSEPS